MAAHWPDTDVVDLWTIDLLDEGPALTRAMATLDALERARAQRIVHAPPRHRFVLARAALRAILGGYLQVAAAEVPLGQEPGGKPRLHPPAGLAFSLSHSLDLAVIAVAARARVGVDVEMLARPSVPPGVLRRVLDERELALVLDAPPAMRHEAFLRHWTAKEAYIKALGTGLAPPAGRGPAGLRGVAIRDALTTPTLAESVAPRERFSLQRFDPRPGAVGAVAVAGGSWTARRREETHALRGGAPLDTRSL